MPKYELPKLSSFRLNQVRCFLLNYDISDHLPIFFTISSPVAQQLPVKSKIRDSKYFNLEYFITDLRLNFDNSFDSVNNFDDVDVHKLFELFQTTFEKVLDAHAPYRTLSRKEIKLKHKPRITKAILKSIQEKKKTNNML